MADLTRTQIRTIEEAMAYPRGFGYVLDFSDRTMEEFFEDEFGIAIYAEENLANGTSKRNCLKTFLQNASSDLALRVLRALWDRREGLLDAASPSLQVQEARGHTSNFRRVIESLEGQPLPATAEGIEAFAPGRTLEELVSDIERTLAAGKPEVAIDHLHTYCMKKFAHLLETRCIECAPSDPLHSRFGKYRKCLEAELDLHEFTVRALKTFTSLLESFNDLRNNRSLAHDNEILDPIEAKFIFSSVGAMLVMLRALESARYGE